MSWFSSVCRKYFPKEGLRRGLVNVIDAVQIGKMEEVLVHSWDQDVGRGPREVGEVSRGEGLAVEGTGRRGKYPMRAWRLQAGEGPMTTRPVKDPLPHLTHALHVGLRQNAPSS